MPLVLPDVTTTIVDGLGGADSPDTSGIVVKMGLAAGGTPNVLKFYTDKKKLVADFVGGPTVEAAAHSLGVAGGPVGIIAVSPTGTAGAMSSVTEVGTGPLMTATGTPNDSHELIVKIVTGGAVATATFQVALDSSNPAGPTYGPILATASTYVIPGTGITIGFPSGTYVAGTTYAATATPTAFTTSDLNTTFAALLADPREWGCVHVIGQAAAATGSATIAAGVGGNMTTAEQNYRYAFALIEGALDTDSNLLSAFANFVNTRVVVAVGAEELPSQITGRVQSRHFGWSLAARIAKAPISEDMGRFASGALPNVISITRDEQATPGLDAARFSTARTIIGQPGFYITNGRLMGAIGSDFQFIQDRRVMDLACKVTRNALLRFLNEGVRCNADGTIYEFDARSIEAFVNTKLGASLLQPNHAVAAALTVNRSANVRLTTILPVTTRIQRKAYAKFITQDIGFGNVPVKAVAA